MEICPQEPFPREQAPSVIEIKNKLKAGHNECCNCCCCKIPQFEAYKYVQPKIPKSYRPIRCYMKPKEPIENDTTYRLSFWQNPISKTEPIIPEGCLTVAEGPFSNETTHNMSYMGNWCPKPEKAILPCKRELLGRGPMQGCTTQKYDFTWKYCPKPEMLKNSDNICIPNGPVADDTTYKLSYFNSACHDPVKSYKPIRRYEPSSAPLEEYTTYRLSFFNNEPLTREQYPWQKKLKYEQPTTPVDGCTTYKLSYWGQYEKPREPIPNKSDENLLNRSPCFEDDTTYGLSYFEHCGDRPNPILPQPNQIFDDCPLDYDTVNRMSYLGNWSPKPEKPILPCTRQLLGRGPIQCCTTQKRDFTWKCQDPNPMVKPPNNLTFSQAPLEACTTNRLSYMANCNECLVPNKSYAPIREYLPLDMPMDLDTTMQLSYQPVGEPPKVEKPWAKKPPYHKPTTHIDDNTTYQLSYMPPGTLLPCVPENPCCSQNSCSTSMRPQVSITTDRRPCISC